MLNKQPLAPESAIPAYTVEDNDPTESTINTAHSLDANSDDEMRDSVIGGAAIAGGVAGLAVCGPALGLVGAVGAGALATQSNKAGDVARASGDVVVAAGDRAKKIDKKHHVVDKTKSATKNALQSAKKFDEKHQVGQKMSNGLKGLADKIRPKKK
mmetsp:Transcript_6815/g.6493  ORF Transcript_6815/g.6493 Transcript_6815/m.6493 type:complete len:156 (-) Transcript_6815:255-722(-)